MWEAFDNSIRDLLVRRISLGDGAERGTHDAIVRLVKEIEKATAGARDTLSASDRSVAARRAKALSDQLDDVALDLYGITDGEERENARALGAAAHLKALRFARGDPAQLAGTGVFVSSGPYTAYLTSTKNLTEHTTCRCHCTCQRSSRTQPRSPTLHGSRRTPMRYSRALLRLTRSFVENLPRPAKVLQT